MALGQPRADRYVIHGSPPWPPPELNKSYFRVRLKPVVVRRNRSGAMQYALSQGEETTSRGVWQALRGALENPSDTHSVVVA